MCGDPNSNERRRVLEPSTNYKFGWLQGSRKLLTEKIWLRGLATIRMFSPAPQPDGSSSRLVEGTLPRQLAGFKYSQRNGRAWTALQVIGSRPQTTSLCIAMHIALNSVPAGVDTLTYQDPPGRGFSI